MSSQGDCALCLESLWSNNISTTTTTNNSNALGTCVPCGHVLHKACYAKWQASSYFRDACPFCSVEEVEFMPLFLNFPVMVNTAADVSRTASASQSTSDKNLDEEATQATIHRQNEESSRLRSTDSRNPPDTATTGFASSSPAEGTPSTDTAPTLRSRSGQRGRSSRQSRAVVTAGRHHTVNLEDLVQPATLRSGRRLVSPNSIANVRNSAATTRTTGSVHSRRRRPKRRRQDGGADNLAFPDVCLELWDALIGFQGTAAAAGAPTLPRRSPRNVIRRDS